MTDTVVTKVSQADNSLQNQCDAFMAFSVVYIPVTACIYAIRHQGDKPNGCMVAQYEVTQCIWNNILTFWPSQSIIIITLLFFFVRYHKAVLLAILLLSSPQFFSNEKKKFVCQVLDTFVKANCHQMLSQFEMLCGIYWGTSAPLIKVLYEVKKPELEADIFDTCKLTILLAMKTLVAKQSHHSVLAKEEMIDYLVCLPWHSEGELKDSATELVSMIRQVPDLHYKPPSLLNMSKATVSMYFCGLHDVVRLSVPELVSNLYPAVNPI